jgi:hypothetical protein
MFTQLPPPARISTKTVKLTDQVDTVQKRGSGRQLRIPFGRAAVWRGQNVAIAASSGSTVVNAKRLTLLVATGLTVTGCGVTAGVLHSGAPTSTPAGGAKAALTLANAPAAPTATSPPAASAPPVAITPPPPSLIVVADETASGPTLEVALLTSSGVVLASSQVPRDARWTIGVGPRAAYWVTGHRLQRLDQHGVVTTLATVPQSESGRVVLSPDGSQWAYATTSTSATNIIINRIYRGAIGRPAQLVAERTADPSHPDADTPIAWQYYLESWTAQGILVERQPVGGCGCGIPFDMQMTAVSAAFINPTTGIATPLGASATCPLSGIASDATVACFHETPTGASDSLRFVNGTHTSQYALSGKNSGGAATFNGSTLAYATVPSTAGGCGGPDWRPQTTLHVMDIRTGNAISIGRTGLAPVAWLADGRILATLSVAHAASTTTTVVAVDPATGSVRTVFNQSFNVIGLA